MDHIELSSAEVEKTLNDTACCVLILDIALSDKNIPKFTKEHPEVHHHGDEGGEGTAQSQCGTHQEDAHRYWGAV